MKFVTLNEISLDTNTNSTIAFTIDAIQDGVNEILNKANSVNEILGKVSIMGSLHQTDDNSLVIRIIGYTKDTLS